MPALILMGRPSAFKRPLVLGILQSLFTIGHRVDIIEKYEEAPKKPYDILIQWAYHKKYQLARTAQYKKFNPKLKPYYVDHGWVNRDKTFLFYDENLERLQVKPYKSHQPFKHTIQRRPTCWIIMLQVPKDANLRNCDDYKAWCTEVYDILRSTTTHPIIFRMHPKHLFKEIPNVEYSSMCLIDDIARAYGIVTWNSSGIMQALMNGVPTCVYDLPELKGHAQIGLTKDWIKGVESGLTINYDSVVDQMLGQQVIAEEAALIKF